MKDVETIERRLEEKGWYYMTVRDERRKHTTSFIRFTDPDEPAHYHIHGTADIPAVSDRYHATGVIIREEWRFIRLHRENGPARIFRDRITGNVVKEEWFIWGHRHRADGPALVKYDRVTGATIYEAFCENGRKLSERSYPENDTHPTRRMVAARNRRPQVRLLQTQRLSKAPS